MLQVELGEIDESTVTVRGSLLLVLSATNGTGCMGNHVSQESSESEMLMSGGGMNSSK
jgi:hypothetical protein